MRSAKPRAAPDEKVWWTGLKWTLATHMQLERFADAFVEQINAELDAEHRRRLNDDSENNRSWRESYDTNYEPYNPQRPLRAPSWALYMQVSSELDLLIVALRNVLRAQDRVPEQVRTSMGDQDVLELLRNIAEHWDETGGRSERELDERYPTVTPDAVSYTNKEIWLGGPDGVPLSRVKAWLYRVELAATRLPEPRRCRGPRRLDGFPGTGRRRPALAQRASPLPLVHPASAGEGVAARRDARASRSTARGAVYSTPGSRYQGLSHFRAGLLVFVRASSALVP
jgi:hypothetical protein